MAAGSMSEHEVPGEFSAEKLDAQILSIEEARDKREAGTRIELRTLADYAAEIIAQSAIPSMDYGIDRLNALAPIQMRSMGTLIGPTGAGKTALAMTLAAHRTRYVGKPNAHQGPTVYFLFELTAPQLAARRTAQLSHYTWRQVLGGVMAEHEIAQTLAGENFFVVKPPRDVDFLDYAPRVLDAVQKQCPGTPLLVADYLQRIKGKGRDIRESVTNVVDGLVDLVESRDMYGLLLSKGSRNGSKSMRDGKTKGEALVDTAAEASAIEAGSSVVLAITYENRDGSEFTEVALQVAKGRFGATGAEIGMQFHGPSGRWTELDAAPIPKAEQEAERQIMDALRANTDGFKTRGDLVKAAGCQRQLGLAVLRRLISPNGRIDIRDGLLFARRAE